MDVMSSLARNFGVHAGVQTRDLTTPHKRWCEYTHRPRSLTRCRTGLRPSRAPFYTTGGYRNFSARMRAAAEVPQVDDCELDALKATKCPNLAIPEILLQTAIPTQERNINANQSFRGCFSVSQHNQVTSPSDNLPGSHELEFNV